jgi:hypothetical protein
MVFRRLGGLCPAAYRTANGPEIRQQPDVALQNNPIASCFYLKLLIKNGMFSGYALSAYLI